MKKIVIIVIAILLLIGIAISAVFATDMYMMRKGRPVLFSTWGMDYAPPEISPQTAIDAILEKFDMKSIKTITNLDNPKVESLVFESEPSIYRFDKKKSLVGKPLYKITFNTTQDGLLGPMVYFVDRVSGDILGAEFRE